MALLNYSLLQRPGNEVGYSTCGKIIFYTGTGEYNAVWDEKLGLCYALVQCKCGIVVGVKLHTVQGVECLETLVGKVRPVLFLDLT